MIKHTEIYKQNTQGEIIYIAKIYIDREKIIEESYSSTSLEKVIEYVISKECVISNYFDMTEME